MTKIEGTKTLADDNPENDPDFNEITALMADSLKSMLPPVPTPPQIEEFLHKIVDNNLLYLSAACNEGAMVLTVMPGVNPETMATSDTFDKMHPALLMSKFIGIIMYAMEYNINSGEFDLFPPSKEKQNDGNDCTGCPTNCNSDSIQDAEYTECGPAYDQKEPGKDSNNSSD